MIRVLLADDQELVREGFRMILDAQEDIEVVGEAADGDEAVRRAHELAPEVVLMDIRMPRTDGIAATRRLMGDARSAARVLILTTFDLDEHVYAAMQAGASGFLLKDVPRRQLIEGVRTVALGDTLLSPTITRRLIEEYVQRPHAGSGIPARLAELTPRELDVTRHVARGLSNAEIADAMVLSEATVKTHVAHVLQKLRLRDRVQIVVLAYECGLIVPGAR